MGGETIRFLIVVASALGGCDALIGGGGDYTVDAAVDGVVDGGIIGTDVAVDAGPDFGPAPTWTQISPASSPPGRADLAMAFDSARGRVVMFGGEALAPADTSTWEYDGATWTEVSGAGSPPGRGGHAMAYDVGRGRIVLFGGRAAGTSTDLGDTWEYDGTSWIARAPPASPPARARHAMAYDASRHRVVLFSGLSFASPETQPPDTWEYDGMTWTRVTPPLSPIGRTDHSMVYDSTRHRVVMFGGARETFERSDTWEYDGTTWREVVTAAAPPGRGAMAFDSGRGRAVAVNGGGPTGGGTWEYDGAYWVDRMLATAPSARHRPAMAFDSARGRVVMFGGMEVPQGYPADTWELVPSPMP